jgi:aryl-alcohol dehydrogenase-like predicted oxidoreductase
MEYRQFGNTGLTISAIGFGCWEIGGTYGRIDEAQFRRAVPQAIGNGINCFDTAEAYGMGVSEGALAAALGSRRSDVCLVTKFGVGYDEMPNRRDSSRARVLASIDKSLQRLKTDHVDVYLVHWPDPLTPLDETMRALDDIVRQGKARYIGVSNFRLKHIEECMCCAASMSYNTPGTCSTGVCRPKSSPTARRSRLASWPTARLPMAC